MLGDLQPEAVGPCPFTGEHIFPLDIAVHQLGSGLLIRHITNNNRHVLQPCQLTGTVAAVSGYDLIPALRVRPDKSRLPYSPRFDGGRNLLHGGIIVPHLKGLAARHDFPQARIALEWVQLR